MFRALGRSRLDKEQPKGMIGFPIRAWSPRYLPRSPDGSRAFKEPHSHSLGSNSGSAVGGGVTALLGYINFFKH